MASITWRGVILLAAVLANFDFGLYNNNVEATSVTLGTACNSTAQCGTNQVCQNATGLSCLSASCQCLPCYALDINSECSPVVGLSLGSSCNDSDNEIYPAFAECSGSTVTCQDGYTQSGANCAPGLANGATCSVDTDCASDYCGSDNTCQCYYSDTIWDGQVCRKRQYGDACSTDDDCQVDGKEWQGLTWNTAYCISGTCQCGNYTMATTNYFNATTGVVMNMTICLAIGATVNASVNTACTLDPVYDSNEDTTVVCALGSVCYHCPENEDSTGTCLAVSVGSLGMPPLVGGTAVTANVNRQNCSVNFTSASTVASNTGSASNTTTVSGSNSGSGSGSSTTVNAATHSCNISQCNGTVYSDAYSEYCWPNSDSGVVKKCSSSTWVVVTNQQMLTNAMGECHGAFGSYFNFSVFGIAYGVIPLGNGYNGGYCQWSYSNGVATNCTQIQQDIGWYLTMLSFGEGSGAYICSNGFTGGSQFNYQQFYNMNNPATPPAHVTFYNTTGFYDVWLDSNGNIIYKTEAYPMRTQPFASTFSPNTTFCKGTSPCCRSRDLCSKYSTSYCDFMSNGTGMFYINAGAGWNARNGEVTAASELMCGNMFSNITFTCNGQSAWLNGYTFYVYNSTTWTWQQVNSSSTSSFYNCLGNDPNAVGVQYYYWSSNDNAFVMVNATNQYNTTLVNGKFSYSTILYSSCSNRPELKSAYTYPSLVQQENYQSMQSSGATCTAATATNVVSVKNIQLCDTTASVNPCGTGFVCRSVVTTSAFEIASACKWGICDTDYNAHCGTYTPASSTPAPSAPTILMSGASCTNGSACYTGYCTSAGVCGCPSCSKVVPGLYFDYQNRAFAYEEQCMPTSTVIARAGDTCYMYVGGSTGLPSVTCGPTEYCLKCPEVFNISSIPATCVSINTAAIAQTGTDPCSGKTCGHMAECQNFGPVSACVCTNPNYQLSSDGKNCYGWETSSTSSCSVTCGSGNITTVYTCDNAASSGSICQGSNVTNTSCYAGIPCALPAALETSAVQITIPSSIITPAIFANTMQAEMTTDIAAGASAACLASATAYVACCGGSAPTVLASVTADCVSANTSGVSFSGAYSTGTDFMIDVVVTVNDNSACCKAGASASRKKRQAFSGMFSVAQLQAVLSNPSVLSQVNQAITAIDPSAALSNASFAGAAAAIAAAIASATTTAWPSDYYYSASASTAWPTWMYGAVIGGSVGGLIFIGLIVFFIVRANKKPVNKVGTIAGRMPRNGQVSVHTGNLGTVTNPRRSAQIMNHGNQGGAESEAYWNNYYAQQMYAGNQATEIYDNPYGHSPSAQI